MAEEKGFTRRTGHSKRKNAGDKLAEEEHQEVKEEDRIRMEKEADEFAKALENQALKDATSPPTKASAKVNDKVSKWMK